MKKHLILALVAALCASSASAAMAQTPSAILHPTDITLSPADRHEITLGLRPEAEFVRQLKGPRETVDGEVLNAKYQYLFEQERAAADTGDDELAAFGTPEGRAAIRAAVDHRWTMRTAIMPEMARVQSINARGRDGDIPVRIYQPKVATPGPLPVLVYYHGGGFVFSSIAAMDRAVRLIANEAGVIVVSVDYRLAPENPYPAAHNDAEDAYLWARAHAAEFGGDPTRVAVGGDSAGGHLAVVTSLRQVMAGRPAPLYQLLYYPAVSVEQGERSYGLFDKGYGLDRGFMEAVSHMTFPDAASFSSVEASPVTAPDLKGMPATILVTAGYDPLRDQGRRFARRLEEQGVSVLYLNYGSLTHSFLNWSGVIEDADRAARQTAAVFGQAIRSRPGLLELAAEPGGGAR